MKPKRFWNETKRFWNETKRLMLMKFLTIGLPRLLYITVFAGPASLRSTTYAGRWDIEITGHAHWPVKQVEQDIRERNFEQNIVS